MAESKMPARIRVAQDADGFWTCREAVSGSPEYIRADLVEQMAKALRETVAKFDACTDSAVRSAPLGINKCRAALQAYEAGQ